MNIKEIKGDSEARIAWNTIRFPVDSEAEILRREIRMLRALLADATDPDKDDIIEQLQDEVEYLQSELAEKAGA